MDTSRDFRILLGEYAVEKLYSLIINWHLPYQINKAEAKSLVEDIRSSLLRIKYSFLPLNMLVRIKELDEISEKARKLAQLLVPQHKMAGTSTKHKLLLAQIRFHIWTLTGLKRRLLLGEENKPEYAIDVIGAEAYTVEKHPRAGNLWIVKFSVDNAGFLVVTNIKGVKKGEIRGLAILPPLEFYGVVSEAMIATKPLTSKYKGKLVPYHLVEIGEVRAKVLNIIHRK